MANRIVLKRSSVANRVPLASDLVAGELAVNLTDKLLYTKDAAGNVVAVGGSGGGGSGTVTAVSVTTANGVSGTVATSTTTPAISIALGAITPTSVAASGQVTGSNLSGTNTGDQSLASLGAYAASNPNGYTSNTGTVTGVTATAPVVSSGGTSPVISMAAANTTTPGYLTAADWTTFNGKQAALGYTPYNAGANTVLTNANYTSYAPSLTGSGASGTWGINITGSAATATDSSKLPLSGGTMTGTVRITNNSIRSAASSGWDGDPGAEGKIQYHANRWYIVADSSSDRIVQFRRNGSDVSYIDNGGTFQGTAANATWAANVYLNSSSSYLIGGSVWAGTGGYPGYQFSGGNGRFGFSSTGGNVDVYADGNFYSTDNARLNLYEDTWLNNKHFGSDGNIYSNASMRAPIFYDQNNTGFYGDFASGSNMNTVNANRFSAPNNGIISIGDDSATNTYSDGSTRSRLYVSSAYPVVTINSTVQGGNGNHGPTLQFSTNGYDSGRHWVIGTGGTGQALDFGTAQAGNRNPHEGIAGYSGSTPMRITVGSNVGIGGSWGPYGLVTDPSYRLHVQGTGYASSDFRAPQFFDANDTAYYCDPNGTSELSTLTAATRTRWDMPRRTFNRQAYTAGTGYWTGTRGWGETINWNQAWGYGFGGFDIWGYNTQHPQGGGYIHAQGICSGLHHVSDDGSNAYGFQLVGGTNASDRLWYRGAWGNSGNNWREIPMFDVNSGNGSWMWFAGWYDNNNSGYYVDPNGTSRMGTINADALNSYGNVIAYYSDERLKTIKGPILNSVEKLSQIDGFYYTGNETAKSLGYDTEKVQLGVSAQRVESVFPELIERAPCSDKVNGVEYKTLDYSKLVPVLIEAIKEQQAQIEELRNLISR